MLYHITSEEAYRRAASAGEYRPDAFRSEGFIHCSYAGQVTAVANRIFRARSGLVLLEIDPARLSCRIVDENLEGGTELFPHVYGPLPLEAVVRVHAFPCSDRGVFELPAGVAASGTRTPAGDRSTA
jgi:uncharacterized protein (DUF952 family)